MRKIRDFFKFWNIKCSLTDYTIYMRLWRNVDQVLKCVLELLCVWLLWLYDIGQITLSASLSALVKSKCSQDLSQRFVIRMRWIDGLCSTNSDATIKCAIGLWRWCHRGGASGDGMDEKKSVGLCGSRACISVQRGKVQPLLRALWILIPSLQLIQEVNSGLGGGCCESRFPLF